MSVMAWLRSKARLQKLRLESHGSKREVLNGAGFDPSPLAGEGVGAQARRMRGLSKTKVAFAMTGQLRLIAALDE
jgi:hypothetical protein